MATKMLLRDVSKVELSFDLETVSQHPGIVSASALMRIADSLEYANANHFELMKDLTETKIELLKITKEVKFLTKQNATLKKKNSALLSQTNKSSK